MALDFGNKVENGGIPPNGVLPASEFNQLVAQVNKNEEDIAAIDTPNSIESIEATESQESGGNNVIKITETNGTETSFNVKNGTDGADGVSLGDVEIADNLTTDDATKVLSAKQGKVLKDLVDSQTFPIVNDLTTGGEESALSAEMGKVLAKNVALIVENLANIAFIGNRPAFEDMGVGTQYQVAYDLTNVTSSNDATTASKGFSFETILTHSAGTSLTINVTMGGVDITSQCYDNSTKKITIEQVTGNISITASASQEVNTMYKGVRINANDGQWANLIVGDVVNFAITPLYDLGENRENSISLTFTVGATNRACALLGFDSNGEFWSYYLMNKTSRTVSVPTTWRYVRLCFPTESIASSSIYNNDTQQYLFNGAAHNISEAQDSSAFLASPYCPQPNENGDYLNWTLTANYNASGEFPKNETYPTSRVVVCAMHTIIGYTKAEHTIQWCLSKKLATPTGRAVTFSAGANEPSKGSSLLVFTDNTAMDYMSASPNPRTVEIGATRNYIQMHFRITNYANCYIHDDTANVDIWKGLNV